ncbi:MAG: ABC transporter ATP-binding protein [Thermoproteus sp.]|nr:ABC transporter ATP-binding protein [Thermoproteus sp.]
MLEIKGIVKQFGSFRALDGVDMTVERGKVTLLIGPNGSGKTTLINVVTGVYRPEAGRVVFRDDGRELDITGWPPHRVFAAGIVRTFQIPQVFQRLTVIENLLAVARGQIGEDVTKAVREGLWIGQERELAERAFRILDMVGLGDVWNQYAYSLSAGQMKLLELARALMAGAKLIVLDEPIAGIPISQAHSIFQTIRDINSKGITFWVVEHRIDIAFKYVDYVYAMASGKVISQGTPDVVAKDPKVIESYIGG